MQKLTKIFVPVAAMLALSAFVYLRAQDGKPNAASPNAASPNMTAPSVVYKVEPQYTEEARAAKVSGSVLLSLTVDTSGDAQDIKVVKSLDTGLDQNAISAVQQWRFSPGTETGKPVDTAAKIEVNFRLQ